MRLSLGLVKTSPGKRVKKGKGATSTAVTKRTKNKSPSSGKRKSSARKGGKGANKSKKKRTKVITPTPKSKMSPLETILRKEEVQQQIAVMLLSTVASKLIMKLDFKNPRILQQSRAVFIVYIVGSQLLFTYMRSKIEEEGNQKPIKIGGAASFAGIPIPGLGGAGLPGIPGADTQSDSASETEQAAAKGKTITVKEHDLAEISKMSNSVMMEMVTTTYMHFTKKAGKPLLFVPLMGLVNKLRSPIVQIHVFNRPAKGRLSRPFKSGMESIMGDILPKPSVPSASAGREVDVGADKDGDDEGNVAHSRVSTGASIKAKTSSTGAKKKRKRSSASGVQECATNAPSASSNGRGKEIAGATAGTSGSAEELQTEGFEETEAESEAQVDELEDVDV